MEKRVLIDNWQKVTEDDLNNFGKFPRASFDTLVGKMLIPDMAFCDFQVTQTAAAEVTVSPGKFMYQGKVYFNDAAQGTPLNLLSMLPAATKRVVAITVWGTEIDTEVEPRTFLTDVETRATGAQETATQSWRWANLGTAVGIENTNPVAPAVPANVGVVAWVTLNTTGVEDIQRNTALVTPTLRGCDNRLNEIDVWRRVIGTRLDTLAADLLALAAKIFGLAAFSFVRRLAADVANLKEVMDLPDLYEDYGSDNFLNEDESQINHVDYLAHVEEGVRFPPAAIEDDQIGLLNPNDETVINTNDVLLPKWTPKSRIANLGTDVELSLTQYGYQTVSTVQKTMTRMRIRYGDPFSVCGNAIFQYFPGGHYNLVDRTFRLNSGEVFEILETTPYPNWSQGLQNWWGNYWGHSGEPLYGRVTLRKRIVDYVDEPYWEAVIVSNSVSGCIVGQTFVNSQDGWLCAIEAYFSQVAVTGDVEMIICETENGAPKLNKIIGRSTVAVGDIEQSPAGEARVPTRFNFAPTFLKKGRYAFVFVTSGNHYVWELKDTNYVSGSRFACTDGEWSFGDPARDICFEAFFCSFERNATAVQLLSLQCPGGIAAIDVLANAYVPEACHLTFEFQLNGVWYTLDDPAIEPDATLNNLPPLLPFRAVFVGTDSVMPALGVASNSRVQTWRPRSDFRHISTVFELNTACTQIQADVRLEAWRGAPHHTFAAKLLYGGGNTDSTTRDPDSTTTEVPKDDPNAIIYHYVWTGQGSQSQFRLRFDGTTDNVVACFHVARRFHVGIA